MFLHFSSPRLFKKAHPAKNKHIFLSLSKFIVFGVLLQLISFTASAGRECIQIPISSYDPSSAYDELTGTITVKATRKQKYTEVCYNVPDNPQPLGGGGSYGGGGGTPPPKPEQPKKCAQMILDVDAVRDACRAIESNTAESLANGCPNLTHYVEGSASGSISFRKFFNFAFGGTWGATYNAQCEARLSFNLGAKLAACDFSASKSKAAIGPCN